MRAPRRPRRCRSRRRALVPGRQAIPAPSCDVGLEPAQRCHAVSGDAVRVGPPEVVGEDLQRLIGQVVPVARTAAANLARSNAPSPGKQR